MCKLMEFLTNLRFGFCRFARQFETTAPLQTYNATSAFLVTTPDRPFVRCDGVGWAHLLVSCREEFAVIHALTKLFCFYKINISKNV